MIKKTKASEIINESYLKSLIKQVISEMAENGEISQNEDPTTLLFGLVASKDDSSVNAHKIQEAIKDGGDPDATSEARESLLHIASKFGKVNAVRVLLRAGANPDVQDKNGRTPLDVAKTPVIKKMLTWAL